MYNVKTYVISGNIINHCMLHEFITKSEIRQIAVYRTIYHTFAEYMGLPIQNRAAAKAC